MAAIAGSIGVSRRRSWSSASIRMEIWATLLGTEVAMLTIALLCYDWSILFSPLP